MNERIKELKRQARDFYLLQEDLDCSVKQLHELVEQKFAELMLTEFKSVLLDMINKGQGEFDTLDQALTEINEHFGVK